jgi:hypothetical protein
MSVWPWKPIKMQGPGKGRRCRLELLSREWGNCLLAAAAPCCSDKLDRHSLPIILLFGPKSDLQNLYVLEFKTSVMYRGSESCPCKFSKKKKGCPCSRLRVRIRVEN